MCRLVARSDDWPAFGGQAAGPGQRAGVGPSQQKLAVGTVQHIEKAVAVGLNHQLAGFTFPRRIDQRRRSHGVKIMHVMRRELEVPLQFAGLRIERDDRVGVEIVPRPIVSDQIVAGVADRPVESVQILVVGPGHPGRSARMINSCSLPGF